MDITLDEAKAQGPLGTPYCLSDRQGYTCTLPEDHDGIHVAHDPQSDAVAAWADDDQEATTL